MAYIKRNYKVLGVARGLSLTQGINVDLGFIQLNSTRTYYNPSIHVVSKTAAGTLAAATLALYTSAGGAGLNMVTATPLTSLTGAGLNQIISATSLASFSSDSLYIRLTAISLNAGTVDVYIYGYED